MNRMTANIRSFFTVKGMTRRMPHITEELPSTRSIYSRFLKMAWPSATESVLVSLVGMVDTLMVSGLGETAVDAVGITNQPKLILLAAIMSLNVGVTAIVARRRGEENQEGANKTLKQCMLISFLVSLTMTILGTVFAKPIMELMGADPAYIDDAVGYFQIIMYSMVFTSLNLTINAAQRGIGKTKISMRTNLAGNMVNVVFNFLLINGIGIFPKMGVRGAAVGTFLCGVTACSMSFYSLLKKNGYLTLLKSKLSDFRLEKETMRSVWKVTSSALVEQFFTRVGFLSYNMMVARLGVNEYATHLICMNIMGISFSFGDGFGISASALVGQSLGAKRPTLASLYGKTGQRVACIFSGMLCILLLIFRYPLMGLFSDTPEVVSIGATIMFLVSFVTFFQTSQVLLTGCLRGAGDTRFVAITSTISIALVRPFLTWLLCYPLAFGIIGAWIGLCIDQFVRLGTSLWRFNSGKWTTIKL